MEDLHFIFSVDTFLEDVSENGLIITFLLYFIVSAVFLLMIPFLPFMYIDGVIKERAEALLNRRKGNVEHDER